MDRSSSSAARKPKAGARSVLRARLEERRPEIEQAALTRVKAIADPSDAADPTYVEGLYGAVSAAVDFGIAATEMGSQSELPLPVALLAQARSAARSGVSLDTVLRRYFAGYSLLGYFLIEEASRDGLVSGAELQRLLASQAVLFDRLLAAIGEEHARESETLLFSRQRRQAERIERLLEGELIDTAEIAYDFDGWHLGVVVSGGKGEVFLRDLVDGLDCRALVLSREEQTAWAWLGTHQRLGPEGLLERARAGLGARAIAVGEPAEGIVGWRLTHRQAAAALPIAQRGPEPVARYAEISLLASALQDDLLTISLRHLYLEPLTMERDGGEVSRKTLGAYLAAERNISSSAAALGVSRNTVASRLAAIERRLGRPLDSCLADIEVALGLDALGGAPKASAS